MVISMTCSRTRDWVGLLPDVLEDIEDEPTDATGVFFPEAAAGYGGCSEPDTAGCPGRLGIVGYGVAVDDDVCPSERLFGLASGDVEGSEIYEGHVVVGAARYEPEAAIGQGIGEGYGIGPDLALVLNELLGHRLAEGNGLGSDGVLHRAALGIREDGAVDGASVAGVGQNQAATGSPEGLMSRRGDDLGLANRRGVLPGGYESGNVGHVHHEPGADLVGNLAEAGEVYGASVGGRSSDYKAGGGVSLASLSTSS